MIFTKLLLEILVWRGQCTLSFTSGSPEGNCLSKEYYPLWPGCRQSPPAVVYMYLSIQDVQCQNAIQGSLYVALEGCTPLL